MVANTKYHQADILHPVGSVYKVGTVAHLQRYSDGHRHLTMPLCFKQTYLVRLCFESLSLSLSLSVSHTQSLTPNRSKCLFIISFFASPLKNF